jgi:hypothetical protein
MTEVELSSFQQFTFNFGLLPGGKESSLPPSGRGERSRNIDDPMQGLVAETRKPPRAKR